MQIDRLQSVAFTGNRVITAPDNPPTELLLADLRDRLRTELEGYYTQGYNTFLTGMAIGWDMLAAEVVLELRKMHHDIRLIAAIPFAEQPRKFSPQDVERYEFILSQADHSHVVCEEGFSRFAYHRRNDFLIANASVLVAYDANTGGGATSTIKKGQKKGLKVVNLYPTSAPVQLDFAW